MSRLLIIGASILQLPAIKKAKELGHYVAVADYNPQAVGIAFADKYYNASTIDIDAIVNVARDFKPDGIMTLATDMPMRSIAAATAALNLPGISMETAVRATDKGAMIEAFKKAGVESPWYYTIASKEELAFHKNGFSYPCILKPTDNAGSRGVTLVNSADELLAAYQYSLQESRSGRVIVEEYLVGQEVSVEIMVLNGVPHVLTITDKRTTGAPYFVETGHSQPSMLPLADKVRIEDLARRAVLAIGIECGPAHVEIMNTSSGPKMIELGARMGGDCITSHLVPLSTGIDMIKATIDIALGKIPSIVPTCSSGSAIRFIHPDPGMVEKIEGFVEASRMNGIVEANLTIQEGSFVNPIHSSIDRVGYIIAQAESADKAVELCEAACRKICITTVKKVG